MKMKMKPNDRADVVLVAMPFAPITHPSPAIGCLSAALIGAGISVKSLYPALQFAKQIGLRSYQNIASHPADHLLGEWIFSQAAFRRKGPAQAYLERFYAPEQHSALLQIRAQTQAWISQWAEAVINCGAKIVGCTSSFCQNCASLALLRGIREQRPDIVTIMGGANCETEMGRQLHASFPFVDYVFSGESDESFPRLCGEILRGERPGSQQGRYSPYILTPFDRCPPRKELQSQRVPDLDKLPVPHYDDYFTALEEAGLHSEIQPGLLAETSRGCYWGDRAPCSFCGLNGARHLFRRKSPQKATDQLAALAQKHGISAIELTDNVLHPECTKTQLPLLEGKGLTLLYEIRPDMTREQLSALRRCGVLWVQAGIEHLHDKALGLLNKGTTALKNVRLLRWCRELGIYVVWNHMAQIPLAEDKWCEETAQLIPLLTHLQPPSSAFSPLRFDRYSCYHRSPAKYGLRLQAAEAYRYVYTGLEDEALNRIAYFFDDQKGPPQILPGQQLLSRRLQDWILEHRAHPAADAQPALAVFAEGPDRLRVTDRRGIATENTYILQGEAAEAYHCCNAGASAQQVARKMHITPERALELLQNLTEKNIVARFHNRYLSLGITCPALPGPSLREIPGGHLSPPPLADPNQLTVADMFRGINKKQRSK